MWETREQPSERKRNAASLRGTTQEQGEARATLRRDLFLPFLAAILLAVAFWGASTRADEIDELATLLRSGELPRIEAAMQGLFALYEGTFFSDEEGCRARRRRLVSAFRLAEKETARFLLKHLRKFPAKDSVIEALAGEVLAAVESGIPVWFELELRKANPGTEESVLDPLLFNQRAVARALLQALSQESTLATVQTDPRLTPNVVTLFERLCALPVREQQLLDLIQSWRVFARKHKLGSLESEMMRLHGKVRRGRPSLSERLDDANRSLRAFSGVMTRGRGVTSAMMPDYAADYVVADADSRRAFARFLFARGHEDTENIRLLRQAFLRALLATHPLSDEEVWNELRAYPSCGELLAALGET